MQRRTFVAGGLAVLATPTPCLAQQPARPVRIGILATPPASSFSTRMEALRAGLRDFGYIEGKNTLLAFRSADGKYDRLPELAADLVRDQVDVIVTGGTPAIRATKRATQAIPIVIAAVGDAVAGGLVASLSSPGGNITGATYFARELAAKQLEMLKEAVPQTTRVAVVVNPDNAAMGPTLRTVESTARSLKVELEEIGVREPRDFNDAFLKIAGTRSRATLIIDDPITISSAQALADLALKHRLATAGFIEYAQAGGLIGYGVNLLAMWRRAAFFVDKILRGANAGDIPMERPTRFDLVINLRTAKALGLTVPQSLLLRADQVIE
jgi:putative tryptophan/tyrosine transport system substrate-binding protein